MCGQPNTVCEACDTLMLDKHDTDVELCVAVRADEVEFLCRRFLSVADEQTGLFTRSSLREFFVV
jgi:hypothetical protein